MLMLYRALGEKIGQQIRIHCVGHFASDRDAKG